MSKTKTESESVEKTAAAADDDDDLSYRDILSRYHYNNRYICLEHCLGQSKQPESHSRSHRVHISLFWISALTVESTSSLSEFFNLLSPLSTGD